MENVRINVRQAHSDTYNGNPYIAFAGIMTGLLSVILFVDELDAVSFTVVGVLLFSGIYAYILSYYCEQYKMFMLERLNKQRARMSPKPIVYCLFDSECSIVLTFHQNHQHRASYCCP